MSVNDELSTKESIEDRVAASPELESRAEEITPEDADTISGGSAHFWPPGPPG